jgi:hypothetical protein
VLLLLLLLRALVVLLPQDLCWKWRPRRLGHSIKTCIRVRLALRKRHELQGRLPPSRGGAAPSHMLSQTLFLAVVLPCIRFFSKMSKLCLPLLLRTKAALRRVWEAAS